MNDDRLLRRTMRANVPISALWGVAVLLLADVLTAPLGTDPLVARAFGVVAVGAAGLFWAFGRREVLRPAEGWLAALGDIAFGATLVVLALTVDPLTTAGRWLVALSGLATIDLGLLEALGTRRLGRSVRTGAHRVGA